MMPSEGFVTEEQVQRCAVCDGPFVLRYRLQSLVPDMGGRIQLKSEWVRCARPDCHHVQPVVVPALASDLAAVQWFGLPSAAPSGPTWWDVLAARPPRAGEGSESTASVARETTLRRMLASLRRLGRSVSSFLRSWRGARA
jgi:hypothetical protein